MISCLSHGQCELPASSGPIHHFSTLDNDVWDINWTKAGSSKVGQQIIWDQIIFGITSGGGPLIYTYFAWNIPTEIRRSIFDKRFFALIWEFGKGIKKVNRKMLFHLSRVFPLT